MNINPLGIVPPIPMHKLNWFEGFRRIKKILSVAFVFGALSVSGFRLFSQPYGTISTARGGEVGFKVQEGGLWPEATASSGDVLVNWKGDLHIFPKDTSRKTINLEFKEMNNDTFFEVSRDLLLLLVA